MRLLHPARRSLVVLIGTMLLLMAIHPAGAIHAQPKVNPTPAMTDFSEVIKRLTPFIEGQLREKGIPAITIALVDDQRVVWTAGFGKMHPMIGRKATADTAVHVGSVSKLYTDIAVMQLVEQGLLDLDAPVVKFIRRFHPENPSEKAITLRQLMTHRSGLVREPPVGNYFDPTQPSLEQTVMSLNSTKLVYPPETKIKYSNAGIATVGYAVEFVTHEPFNRHIQRALLQPLGMKHSAFELTPTLTPKFADALMWTYQGRTFPAPTFEMGLGPAGSMVSTVTDQTRLMRMIFGKGEIDGVRILKPESLEAMMTPQFPKPGDTVKIGLGFFISDFEGTKRVGHGGAVYGFATEFAVLPEEKLGVVVVATKDIANAVSTRIADEALRMMRAVKSSKPLPTITETKPLTIARARELAGRYKLGDEFIDLSERDGHLWMLASRGGYRLELKAIGDGLIVDDLHNFGQKVMVAPEKLTLGDKTYTRVEVPMPVDPPAIWNGLIGDYGWDHNTLTILEKDGKLHALIEWAFLYPLTQESEDVYAFPSYGLYQDEKLIFTRDKAGRATSVNAAEVVFKRRKIDGEDGQTFRIKPLRPIATIRDEALVTKPTVLKGVFRPSELTDLATIDPSMKFDIRYATDNNFMGKALYSSARAFMQKPAAEALARVHRKLEARGLGILVHDAYRPWHVTKMFWEATPENLRNFVANPATGSRHNRGCAVDLTLFDRKTGEPVTMVSGFDEFSDRAYPEYIGGTSRQRWYRELLRTMMEAEGFAVYENEWWHYDYQDWKEYNLQNDRFEDLKK